MSKVHPLSLLWSLAALLVIGGSTACEDPKSIDGGNGGDDTPSADDVDGDGTPNGSDNDIDGDGNENAVDLDIDGDRIPNEIDDDIDGDGTGNGDDDTPFGANPDDVVGPWADPDGDGQPNLTDTDDNNDSIPDGVAGVNDCDGDGAPEPESSDCDGFCEDPEAGFVPCDDGGIPGTGAPDTDGDGTPNPIDPDDDNDGVPDGDDPSDTGIDPCFGIEGPPPAECDTPTGTDPGEGEGEGEEGEGEGEVPPNCSEQVFDPAAPVPPRILLVVDRSGSMNDDAVGFPGSKWSTAVSTLDTVTHVLEDSVELGLALYPAGAGQALQCQAGGLEVDVRLNNANAIVNALENTAPGGGTPTAPTLLVARGELQGLGAQGGQRAIVLATDGGPNCNESLDGDTCTCVAPDPSQCAAFSGNCLDDVNTIASAAQVANSGFPVFVLGLPGTENFTGVLRSLAQAGGTNDFYNANSADALAQSLEDIAVRLGACRFDLPGSPRPDQITVAVDGAAIGQDTQRRNGWDLIDSNTIELFGDACTTASRAQQNVTVQTCF
jgi:hypothetical protein